MNARLNHPRLITLLLAVILLHACRKKDVDAIPTQPATLFTYRLVDEGDGMVRFAADSTLAGTAFIWDFGDGSAPVTTQTATVFHAYRANATYQVTLVARRQGGQQTATKPVNVATRLARTFMDLPADERDTIRILCVLTDNSFKAKFTDPSAYAYEEYRNRVFTDFMKRTLPDRPAELDRLVFKHIAYSLSADEMARFNQGGDPVGFLNQLLSTLNDPLYQKILGQKRKEAVSRVAFMLKDPAPNGVAKYNYGGYAFYEGGYFVLLSTNTFSFSHELGHSFGFAHDTLRGCQYYPLMAGAETTSRGSCGSLWNDYPEFQVSGFVNKLVVLEAQPARGYRYAVPAYWRDKFPNDRIVDTIAMNYITTTPYYRSGIDLTQTITDVLISQYNTRLAPSSVPDIYTNAPRPGGRLASANKTPAVYCPR